LGPQLLRKVSPRALVADGLVDRGGLDRLHRADTAGVSARLVLLARLIPLLLPGLGDLPNPAPALPLPLGLTDLLDDLIELLDNLPLFLAGLLAGVGLPEPLLDLAHLLDGVSQRVGILTALLALLGILLILLPLPAKDLLKVLVEIFVFVLELVRLLGL